MPRTKRSFCTPRFSSIALFLTLLACLNSSAKAQNKSTDFPDTVDGLKSFLHSLAEIANSGDEAVTNTAFRRTEIPNAESWFSSVFGDDSGARLSVLYLATSSAREEELKKQIVTVKTREREILASALVASAGRPLAPLEQSLLSARKKSELFYSAKLVDLTDNSVIPLGYFVQVASQFRLVDPSTIQAIDPSKPLRLRPFAGGPLAKTLHKPQPIYPDEAKDQAISGSVVLEAIIGTDGSVKEIKTVSGNTLLVQAARNAVMQWSFEPPTFRGTPVELIAPVELTFNFNAAQPAGNSTELYKVLPATLPPASYPEKGGGLEKELRDLAKARKSGDKTTEDAILRSFVLPDPQKWFTLQFGDDAGKNMADQYIPFTHGLVQQLKSNLQRMDDMKFNDIDVRKFDRPCDDHADDYVYPLLLARVEQAPLYEATFRNGNSYNQMNSFVFAEGAFRFIGRINIPESLLFDELRRKASDAPAAPASSKTPKTVKLGGNVASGRLLKRVPPVYPEDARRNYVQGTVRLLAIIQEDGSIGELRVAKGVCSLSKAAIDAVKQWRYQPFSVGGQNVRIYTTIDTIFTLNH
jgi:TonB family protein